MLTVIDKAKMFREIVNEMEFKPCFFKDEKTYNGLLVGRFKKNELSDEEIIHLRQMGKTYNEICKELQCGKHTVSRVLKGLTKK